MRFPLEWGGLGGSLEDVLEVTATLAADGSNVAHALRIHFDQTDALLLSPRMAFNELQIKRLVEGAIFGGASAEARTSRPGKSRRNCGAKAITSVSATANFIRRAPRSPATRA